MDSSVIIIIVCLFFPALHLQSKYIEAVKANNFNSFFGLMLVVLISTACSDNIVNEDGLKTIYYEDGKTLRQSIEYKNGKKNGYMKEFYNTGILMAKQFYINDSLSDTTVLYFPDGRIKSLQIYKNSLKHGCWKEYNKSGKLYSEIFFKNGNLDSTSTVYTYRTGRLLTRVTYKDGLKNGLEERYYSNGKPQSKVWYEMGKPCPGTEEWLDNGKKLDLDFKVFVKEKDELLLNNKVTYYICPEKLSESDKAYCVLPPERGKGISSFKTLRYTKEGFMLEYEVQKGNHVMTKEYIAIFRKTPFRNTFIKVHPINVAINNY